MLRVARTQCYARSVRVGFKWLLFFYISFRFFFFFLGAPFWWGGIPGISVSIKIK